ncbi:MAG: amino acid permease [Candidatus Babeliales bacterium]|jgi:amino acid transporter
MANQSTTKIGLATATIIGMNAMIGTGIFTAPAAMASHVGPAGILAYIFVVISVWFIALSLSRVASLFPQEGSYYTYAKQWGGHVIGSIAGWAYMIGLLIAMGLLSQAAGDYLHQLLPMFSSYTLGLTALVTLILLNMFGVVLSEVGQYVLIVCTLFPLLTTTVMCLLNANIQNLFPFAPFGFVNILKATRIVIFGFFGFECAASLFNIVSNPQRNVPRAVTYSIILVGLIYTLFIASLILSVPLGHFTDSNVPLPAILSIVFPQNPWMILIIHLSILSAIIGTIHSMIWSSSSLLLSLTKTIKNPIKNLITGYNTEKQQRIAVGIVGFSIFASFSAIKNMNLFFSLTAICLVTANLLAMTTLLTIKEEWTSKRNILTILGVATSLIILFFAIEGFIQEI